MEPINKNLINIQRPAFKQNDFDSEFKLKIDTNKKKLIKNNFDPRRLLNIFTILNRPNKFEFVYPLIGFVHK